MIRELKSGGYRLYSRRVDPKTGKRRNLGTFDTRAFAKKGGGKARARRAVFQAALIAFRSVIRCPCRAALASLSGQLGWGLQMIKSFRAISVLAVIAVAQPAHSMDFAAAIAASIPDVIGQTAAGMGAYRRCDAFASQRERYEASAPGAALMREYFAAASAGKPRAAFFKLTDKTKWTSGKIVADQSNIDAPADPLAIAGNTLAPFPLRFYRAGTFSTAHGQWAVHAPDGSVAGVYDGLLERDGKIWKFRELAVLGPDDPVVPADSFCKTPGDMTEYDVTDMRSSAKSLEKQLARRKANFALADEKARAAEARAVEYPRTATDTAKRLRASADAAAKQVADSEKNLAKLRESLAKAEAQLAEYRALAGPARNAENFREPFRTM